MAFPVPEVINNDELLSLNFCQLQQCFTVSLGSKTALTCLCYTKPTHKNLSHVKKYRVIPNIQILEKHVVEI